MLTGIVYFTFQLIVRAKLYENKLKTEHDERIRENEIAEMKMRFFTNISHEIRTPLTLIQANVSLLAKILASRKLEFGPFHGIRYSTNRLLSLVDQLLSLRKLENDTLDLKIRNEEIVQLTHNLIQPFEYIASSRNITIDIASDFDKQILPLDIDKYEKIMTNLLSNALKNSKEKGSIKIKIENLEPLELSKYFNDNTLTSKDSFVKISVTDNGHGIPEKDLPYIFDRYQQPDKNKNKPDYSGTGIGLNFTKRLVELHRGAITVSSTENVETCFSFVLSCNMNIYEKTSEKEKPTIISTPRSELVEPSKKPVRNNNILVLM